MSDWGPFSLADRVAVVTGGARGIGLGIAKALHDAGAQVVVADLRAPDDDAPDGIDAVECDLSRPEAGDELVDIAVARHGRVDVVVNNVGIFPNYTLEETDAAVFDRFSDVNVRSHFLVSRAFARHVMTRGSGGKIVNVSSIDAVKPSTGEGHAAYGTVKAAILGLTHQTARELSHLRINVNAICPGVIITEGVATTTGRTTEQLEDVLQSMLTRIPVGRFGRPDDIGSVALFLASPASDFITGQHIVVDGGLLLT